MSAQFSFKFAPGDEVQFVGAEAWVRGVVLRVMADETPRRLIEVRHAVKGGGQIVNWYGEEVLKHADGGAEIRVGEPVARPAT